MHMHIFIAHMSRSLIYVYIYSFFTALQINNFIYVVDIDITNHIICHSIIFSLDYFEYLHSG